MQREHYMVVVQVPRCAKEKKKVGAAGACVVAALPAVFSSSLPSPTARSEAVVCI
jgi:hypothetical protein